MSECNNHSRERTTVGYDREQRLSMTWAIMNASGSLSPPYMHVFMYKHMYTYMYTIHIMVYSIYTHIYVNHAPLKYDWHIYLISKLVSVEFIFVLHMISNVTFLTRQSWGWVYSSCHYNCCRPGMYIIITFFLCEDYINVHIKLKFVFIHIFVF